VYCDSTEKTIREQIEANDDALRYQFQDPQQKIAEALFEMGMPKTHDDMNYIEQRVYHDYVGTTDFGLKDTTNEENSFDRSWTPYEQDLSQYPEVFKKY